MHMNTGDCMTRMIGCCGIDCDKCPSYMASLNGNEDELERIASEWSTDSMHLTADDVRCYGCHAGVEHVASFCADCDVRTCAQRHGFGTCAECVDYPCEKLKNPHEADPKAKELLDSMRTGNYY